MAGSFNVTEADLAKASQSVQQTVADIQSQMRSLQSAVEPLGASWKGQAYQAFQQLMERFQADGTKLTQALDAIGQAIDANNKTYTATEQQNHSAISNILGSLQ